MAALLPPSSSVTRLMPLAATAIEDAAPTGLEPVKVILSTPG